MPYIRRKKKESSAPFERNKICIYSTIRINVPIFTYIIIMDKSENLKI